MRYKTQIKMNYQQAKAEKLQNSKFKAGEKISYLGKPGEIHSVQIDNRLNVTYHLSYQVTFGRNYVEFVREENISK